jgi:hypothetical protein
VEVCDFFQGRRQRSGSMALAPYVIAAARGQGMGGVRVRFPRLTENDTGCCWWYQCDCLLGACGQQGTRRHVRVCAPQHTERRLKLEGREG